MARVERTPLSVAFDLGSDVDFDFARHHPCCVIPSAAVLQAEREPALSQAEGDLARIAHGLRTIPAFVIPTEAGAPATLHRFVIPTAAGAPATLHHFVIPTEAGAPATAKGGTCCSVCTTVEERRFSAA
jgi:hypothetical protein